MPMTVALHRKLEEVDPQLRGVLFAILEEMEQQREETVIKGEFNELKEIVRDLAEAQKETETRLNRLGAIVGELAEAQRQTEKRINELAEAQRQTENRLSHLEVIVSELAEAQKQAENRLSRVEVAIGQLTASVKDLVDEQAKTKNELTGLTTTVGFALEDRAYKSLPALLQQEFGLEVQGKLERKYVTDNKGEQLEVNIIGEATRNGDRFVIIGESKSQLSRNKVDAFLRKKLKRLEGVFSGELFPIMVTYMISQPDVAKFALQQGIKRVYYSYEFSS